MADTIKYYLDQNITGGTAEGLRALGIDVTTAQEEGRCGYPDPDQLAFATAEGRVLVTFDRDFLAIHATGIPHAGIVRTPPKKYTLGGFIHALEILHGVYTAAEMVDQLEYL